MIVHSFAFLFVIYNIFCFAAGLYDEKEQSLDLMCITYITGAFTTIALCLLIMLFALGRML